MRRDFFILLAVLTTATCNGSCDSDVDFQTITLSPAFTDTLQWRERKTAEYTCWPNLCIPEWNTSGWDRSCKGPSVLGQLAPGAVGVGYDYLYENGTEPCNCWWYSDCVLRGGVRFDLGVLAGKNVNFARLKWSGRGSCVARLFVAANHWTVFSLYGAEEIVSPWPPNSSGAGDVEVGETVREWVLGQKPNHGFIFVGPDESFANDLWINGDAQIGSGLEGIHRCVGGVGTFELEVTYTD